MATVGPITISVDLEPMRLSVEGLASAVETSEGVLDRLVEAGFGSLIFGDDLSGLFRCEAIDGAATGAFELHGFRVMPDERYIELVSAITRDGNPYVSGLVHGWPILSVVARTTTVAEAGGAATAPGGGPAA